ncbi:MAG: NTPase [Candidatus Thermoplasmatota archaeon]|jgi:nucleoside-triphosphatase|nr:NTPase [Candidatus Thermoplasmatota archaeon]MCL5990012.1 NTPase [Candidatus Thermoplasmatota archaeon]MCW6170998.1 NTPase [Thermoplasmatales archaeon]
MAVKVGITGPVGSIKAEAVSKIIDMLQKDGKIVQGVLVSEIVENNKLYGYSLFDINTKKRIVFAQATIVSRVKIDKLGVDTRLLEEILIPSLKKAREEADVIIIDEIGKLENTTKTIRSEIQTTLKSEKPLIVTLHKKSRNPVLQEIRSLEGIRVFDITPINRNILPFKVLKVLKGEEGVT